MELLKILKDVEVLSINGPLDIEIKGISYDSRDIKDSYMFICIKGYNTDGHTYISQAIENGAKAIVIEDAVVYKKDIVYIKVKDTKKDMAILSKNFFNNPCDKIDMIGITGTNGKTSTVNFIKQLLGYNEKVGTIGTIDIYDGKDIIQSKNTTPSSLDIFKYLDSMYQNGCKYCVMEVSSHALALNRVDKIDYNMGIFTNLTQDHLDFHKTIENYKKEKEKLFYKTKEINIFNIDDKVGREFFETNSNENVVNYTYGTSENADFRAKDIKLYPNKTEYTLQIKDKEYHLSTPVLGYFSVYNTLAAICACKLLNMDIDKIVSYAKSLKNVPGRLDYVHNDKGVDIIVDYAHTPDAINNLIKSVREFIKGRIILVFGCGGDRDKTKRPIMGKIAQQGADLIVITSDNPRFENPSDIIEDILEGIDKTKKNYIIVEDRKEAIKKAIEIYKKGDIVIIAGKGHEDYQINQDKKIQFNDKLVALEILDN